MPREEKRDFVMKNIVDPVRESQGNFILWLKKDQHKEETDNDNIVRRIMQIFRNMTRIKKDRRAQREKVVLEDLIR